MVVEQARGPKRQFRARVRRELEAEVAPRMAL